MEWTPLAKGLFASCPGEIEGPVQVVNGVKDIVKLMKDSGGRQSVVVTNVAGGTAVSTIIKRTKAVVSTIGGANSHIVVVARDFGVPCIVGAGDLDLGALPAGAMLRLSPDGTISIDAAYADTGSSDAVEPAVPTVLVEQRSPLAQAQFRLLRNLAFTGAAADVSDILGVVVETAAPTLEELVASGLVAREEVLTVTPAGEQAVEQVFRSDRAALNGHGAALHEQFRPLDRELKRLASAWQDSEVADDWDGRVAVVGELGRLLESLTALLTEHRDALGRFAEYPERLERALVHVQQGDSRYVAAVSVDSFHTVWFQLHEDLLRVLGEDRDPE